MLLAPRDIPHHTEAIVVEKKKGFRWAIEWRSVAPTDTRSLRRSLDLQKLFSTEISSLSATGSNRSSSCIRSLCMLSISWSVRHAALSVLLLHAKPEASELISDLARANGN